MGEYFTPTFLNSAGDIVGALDPQDYGSGLKLAGHSRADSRLMYAVQTVLALDGGARLVWAGDYAAAEPGHRANLYFLIQERHFLRFEGLIGAGVRPNRTLPRGNRAGVFGYVCNADKQHYLENLTLPIDDTGWRRTPLPWLTAECAPLDEGAGAGSLGSWARDRLYYTQCHPGPDWTPVAPAL
ncbi:hypothetical protein F0Q45_26395 [Mycobacterium simiae]|uniref:Uncharacterized protein n=2 Tax=Mycobacterium simiae TaxID=1784 RepID=A0A5B1B2V4_MYCSI|nr:hypothetical protein F0Q45_26395 [Mycobacterium simiae]